MLPVKHTRKYVEEAYTKQVSNKIVIKAPGVLFDSPLVVYIHKKEKSFWNEAFSLKSLSFATKIVDVSNSLTSAEFKSVAYNKTKFEVSKPDGKAEFITTMKHTSASLRSMVFAMIIISCGAVRK